MNAKKKTSPQSELVGDPKLASVLAANLRAYRKAKGWSQADLAEHTGTHLTNVSRIELGVYLPSVEFVVKAARAFGVGVDILLTPPEDGPKEVRIEDVEMGQRLQMLEKLEKQERDALITVIDSMLTKHRIKQFLEDKPLSA